MEVPPFRDREAILLAYAEALAVPHGVRMYALLRRAYYWSGMKADCLRVCRDHPVA